MRLAGLPKFRKTWGQIADGLIPGTYTIMIDNKYDMSDYQGKKNFVISTTNFLGGKNYFLAIAYLTVGVLCVIFIFALTIAKLNKNHNDKKRKKEYLEQ
jgi:LEM3 (ligand-effect modulator 3) family / CDC50 family